ncbi:MAG: hypothetical protein U9M90_04055 [Patescibacteria group bacterium]|nr:hypothetical protein [Patescibacteria group bacterium]
MEIANKITSYEKVKKPREFVTYKGDIEGRNVCVTSTGIRCPSAAIVVEELANCGVKTFIRVGTTGTIQAEIKLYRAFLVFIRFFRLFLFVPFLCENGTIV